MVDVILYELHFSFFVAVAACFWAFFFTPLEGPKEKLMDFVIEKTKSDLVVEYLSYFLYCPKCVALWGALASSLIGGLSVSASVRLALLSSVMAYLLSGVLGNETAD